MTATMKKKHPIPAHSRIMKVTPAMAVQWLTLVIDLNRNVNDRRVQALSLDMQAGRWLVTHQGIAFSVEGRLIDGQHRMHAVVRAGIPVEMMVNVNCDPATFKVIDVGIVRTSGHILHMAAIKNATGMAAAVTLEYIYANDLTNGGGSIASLTKTMILEEAQTNPGLSASLDFCTAFKSDWIGLLPASQVAFVHHRAKRTATRDLADEFVEGLATGIGLQRGDPRLALRNRLFKIARDPLIRTTAFVKVLFLIKVWNAWVRGEKLGVLRLGGKTDDDGKHVPQPLPRILGKKRGQK